MNQKQILYLDEHDPQLNQLLDERLSEALGSKWVYHIREVHTDEAALRLANLITENRGDTIDLIISNTGTKPEMRLKTLETLQGENFPYSSILIYSGNPDKFKRALHNLKNISYFQRPGRDQEFSDLINNVLGFHLNSFQ